MLERQPLVYQASFDVVTNQSVFTPSLLLREYKHVKGISTFTSSRVDYHSNSVSWQLPQQFETETLPLLDNLLNRHSAWFLPFYMFSMLAASLFSLIGSALPTFIGCIFMLFFNYERNRKLKKNMENIIEQENELNFKPKGLLLVLNPNGGIGKFDLGGSWTLNIVSNASFIDNGTPNMKIHEIVATNDTVTRLFNQELPQCISERFGLSQIDWGETIEEMNRIYLSEIEMEERLIIKPLYCYLFACSFLFNIPILVTFPIPIIYYLIVKYLKINKFKQSNQVLMESFISERNEKVFVPKGLYLNLIQEKAIASVSTYQNILQLCQLQH
ncbi:predicted protein [Naegleria gruberi]|uniref:Predicted protein n=1 Tax=Naegleria gruberi TaxID=5762 RepID=D2W427_NAEGR|nr:uncharacterized protein NAEGRDRAFT_76157 [Naegleria gruberi]EFC36170.1 predicted protein [Naegleria gruberi]|eukprot:XP_002668914.1 predicted protein [Naegleria gruberi strain NEG-M]